MSIGPGKYGDVAERARIETQAEGVVMIVLGGNKGSGFDVQGPGYLLVQLPDLLEDLAKSVRKQMPAELRALAAHIDKGKPPEH